MSTGRRLFVLLALLPLLSCGGGSGGGPTGPGNVIVFTPDRAPTANSISLRGAEVNGNRITLELFATEVGDISLVSFILDYPTNLLTFEGGSQGDFFGADGILTVTEVPIIGLFVVNFASEHHNGSGVILRLSFSAERSGRGAVRIESPEAQNLDGTVLDDVTWIGGSIDVEL